MRTKSPMKGLLRYSAYAASGNASITLFAAVALAVVFLATGNQFFFNMLVLCALIIFPMIVIGVMGMGNWERFQLTMPVRRDTLLTMQYLSIILCAFIGVALVAITAGAGYALGISGLFDDGMMELTLNTVPALGMPFLMAGVVFPLASTKRGQEMATGILTTSQFITIGVVMLTPWAASRFDVSLQVIGLWVVAMSMVAFVGSYFVTRMLYAKLDF